MDAVGSTVALATEMDVGDPAMSMPLLVMRTVYMPVRQSVKETGYTPRTPV